MLKKKAASLKVEAVRPPAHAQVYEQLRDLILSGELAPGQAVTIQGLTVLLGAGMTPVREAIRRLISDGALVFQGNRRVSVPRLKSGDIEELIYVRKSTEPELARRAAERIDKEGVAALSRIDAQLDSAIASGDIKGYLTFNHAFHAALYTWADAPIMTEIVERLWLRFGPSLRVVCGRLGTENLPDMHKDILEALLGGDGNRAAMAMEADVLQGMEQVARALDTGISPTDSIDMK